MSFTLSQTDLFDRHLTPDDVDLMLAKGKEFDQNEILNLLVTQSKIVGEKILITSDRTDIGFTGYSYILNQLVFDDCSHISYIKLLIREFEAELYIDTDEIPIYNDTIEGSLGDNVVTNLKYALKISDRDTQEINLNNVWNINPMIYYDIISYNIVKTNFENYYYENSDPEFQNENFSITIDQTTFLTNKEILISRSEFFRNLSLTFSGSDTATPGNDEESWSNPDSFREFLSLIRFGKFTEKTLDSDIILSLLTAAEYFELAKFSYPEIGVVYYPFTEFLLINILDNWKIFTDEYNIETLYSQLDKMNISSSVKIYLERKLQN